ncbi:MAG: C4-dicarboxylate ABC transporter substrate-binding protein [Hyphomicrobiaceae bacterium]|nr:C4-dicarboxylate ABC transporter substrate-binding protein [Hyphomicrobiaceae bacterium]
MWFVDVDVDGTAGAVEMLGRSKRFRVSLRWFVPTGEFKILSIVRTNRRLSLLAIAVVSACAAVGAVAQSAAAQGQTGATEPSSQASTGQQIVVAQANRRRRKLRVRQTGNLSERQVREQINSWVVGVAAGRLEGAPVRLVEEMSRVLDGGNDLQILPVITRGPAFNVHALLYLRGIDLGVVNGDVLDYYIKEGKIARLKERVNYITLLYNSELQILARPEIKSIKDLAGKEVNFNTKGTAAAFTGSLIFDRLKIGAKKTYIPHPVAMKQFAAGERFAAVVFVTAKPVRALSVRKWPKGYHLLSVPFGEAVADAYVPATLDHKDYPALVPTGQSIDTIAVPTVLAAYNWSSQNPRRQTVSRFVDHLFERFGRLRRAPFHPKWRSVNLAATVPGWNRLPAVEAKLKEFQAQRTARTRGSVPAAFRERAAKVAPNDPKAQQKLFDEFIEWYQKRQKTQTQAGANR